MSFLGWSFLSFLVLFYVIDVVENVDKFIDQGTYVWDVVLYYLNYTPYILVLVSPIAVLLAANFSCGNMSKNREVVAIRSGGISSSRVAIPLLAFGLIWSILVMLFGELIVPKTNANLERIKHEKIDRKSSKRNIVARDILYQVDESRVFSINVLDTKRGICRDVMVVTFTNENQIENISRAKTMVYLENRWELRDGFSYVFQDDSSRSFEQFIQKDISLKATPIELAQERTDPDEMGFFQLQKFIEKIEKAGGEPLKEKTDLIMKISYPFINFIIILFGVPLVLRFRRGGLVLGFAQSVTIAFIYFGAIRTGQVLGYNGNVTPLLGATMGNILFGSIGAILLFTYRE